MDEPILEPALPIVDAHHHLWFQSRAAIDAMQTRETVAARGLAATFRRFPKYLLDELLLDLSSGHHVIATVFNEARAMYRADGPVPMRSVGEVEFVNGVAAMAASGLFGPVRACAGIVGSVDLRLGDAAEPVLQAHLRAAPDRYRGVRHATLHDDDTSIFGHGEPHLLSNQEFREGFKWLHRLGLSFDALVLEPQLPDVIDLARAFPETRIILNHVGCPVGVGNYAGRREDRFPIWRANMIALARCENVAVKLGGLGSPCGGFSSQMSGSPVSSEQLAHEWRPYIETCIEVFSAQRCMFESNFPVDSAVGSYATIWNAFKRITAHASVDEKTALFSGTAIRFYRLDI
jgi:predicted TIM-barrel fold metal-dependent hydrolase